MLNLFLIPCIALGNETPELTSFVHHENPAVQIRALETLVELEAVSNRQLVNGWSSSEGYVREQLASSLYQLQHAEGLQLGWSAELSDKERCRLALRLSTMGYEDEMILAASAPRGEGASWPVYSQGTLEDKWACAIASSTLLSMDAPLRPLLERGDFPFSLPYVWDVYTFASKKTVQSVYDELEWVEEGLRAPFWTAMLLQPTVILEGAANGYQQQIEQWSVEECLDATDMAWSIGLRYPERKKDVFKVLSDLEKHSSVCKEWGRLSRASLQQKLPRSIINNATDIRSDKDDIWGALRLLSTQSSLNKRQIRKARRVLSPMLTQELESTIRVEFLRGLHLWLDPSDVEMMALLDDIEKRTTDATILVEVSIAKEKLHRNNQ